MKHFHYETNCGQYVLHENQQPIGPLLDEVAIAYEVDPVDGLFTLHKHGSPENVNRWAENSRAKLRQSKDPLMQEMADAIQVVQGRFDLNDLNGVLENSARLKNLLAKMNPLQVDGVEIIDSANSTSKVARVRSDQDIVDAVDVSEKENKTSGPSRIRFRSR
jgi:uncharacterized protein (UPF0147 family)